MVTNSIVGMGNEPDATFVSFESIASGDVELIESNENDSVEINGTPDMVLEVVSRSCLRKVTIVLRDLYWQAGIPEYWLVDARLEPAKFDILTHGAEGYVPMLKAGGWLKSHVFGRMFRIAQGTDRLGKPEFTLEMKK